MLTVAAVVDYQERFVPPPLAPKLEFGYEERG
jgi:hypothetical protein